MSNNLTNSNNKIYNNIVKDYNLIPIINNEPNNYKSKTNNYIIDILEKEPLLMNHLNKNYNFFQLKNNFIDIRDYKDTSTSVFNYVFFDKKKILFSFLYYTYQLINYEIITKINIELFKNDTYLRENEYIYLISKGGNMMSIFFNKYLNKKKIMKKKKY